MGRVHIRSDRQYSFEADRHTLWAAITEVDEYPRWWPWLREFDGRDLVTGETWACAVRPPLPYVVRFSVRLEDVDPARHVVASIDGDIIGDARLELQDRGNGCVARLTSHLSPDHRALQAMAVLARPLVRRGHDWVLDTGARQFRSRFRT